MKQELNSICRFIPPARAEATINTINFVYEADAAAGAKSGMSTVYRIHYVTEGSGVVSCNGKHEQVEKGDIFFAFPAVNYSVSGGEDFRYMYISFIGIRANAELERLGIGTQNFVFRGFLDIYPFWSECIGVGGEVTDLISESVLLYTLSKIATWHRVMEKEEAVSASVQNATLVKNYIDNNFSDPGLSLEQIGQHFSYHKKYISSLFKRQFKIGVVEYIHTVRTNHAARLIEEGHNNVTEVALSCGFSDALYFSKVFKKMIGISPKKYMAGRQKE
ncbi:MAG: AraC family transcriptional regulator [Ruminococcaceae bacterium]|nr:AraC family transcriptional regulator [Oscillospiraceae bacterium]